MVRLLDIKRTYSDGGMRLLLLADSKEDTLPTLLSDIDGLSGAGGVTPGSIVITPALDVCINITNRNRPHTRRNPGI